MLVDSCQAPGRSCQHLNFCFPCKTEHFYWLGTKELCWEASVVSFNFFFIFLSSSLTLLSNSKNLQKFKCSWHLAGAWHLSGSLFLNPYYFTNYIHASSRHLFLIYPLSYTSLFLHVNSDTREFQLGRFKWQLGKIWEHILNLLKIEYWILKYLLY